MFFFINYFSFLSSTIKLIFIVFWKEAKGNCESIVRCNVRLAPKNLNEFYIYVIWNPVPIFPRIANDLFIKSSLTFVDESQRPSYVKAVSHFCKTLLVRYLVVFWIRQSILHRQAFYYRQVDGWALLYWLNIWWSSFVFVM